MVQSQMLTCRLTTQESSRALLLSLSTLPPQPSMYSKAQKLRCLESIKLASNQRSHHRDRCQRRRRVVTATAAAVVKAEAKVARKVARKAAVVAVTIGEEAA